MSFLSFIFFTFAFKYEYKIKIPNYYYEITQHNIIPYHSKKYNFEFIAPYLSLEIIREISKGNFRTSFLPQNCYYKKYNFINPSKIFLNSEEIKIIYDDKNKEYKVLTGRNVKINDVNNYLDFISECYLNSFKIKYFENSTNVKELIKFIVFMNLLVYILIFIFWDLKRISRLT